MIMSIMFSLILFVIIAPFAIMSGFCMVMFIIGVISVETGYQPKMKSNRKPPNKGSNLQKD